MKEIRRLSTCNQLDLQILGSQTIMPKNLPHHWVSVMPWCVDTSYSIDKF